MVTIRFAKDGDTLVKSLDFLLILAPQSLLGSDAGKALLPKQYAETICELAEGMEPGRYGTLRETRCNAGKLRLVLALLPDEVSRYVGPTRGLLARDLVHKSGIAQVKKGGALMLLEEAEHWLANAAAIVRACPLFDLKTGKPKTAGTLTLCGVVPGKGPVSVERSWRSTIGATRAAARLVDMPPSDLDPAGFSREAKALLRGVPGVRLREITGNKLLEEKLGGIHGVGRCAKAQPRLLIASLGSSRSRGNHVCLVGKGVTFDTGGLNLKPRTGMGGMKSDMGGAAAVLGAFRALAGAGFQGRVTALICLAENAIGPLAVKPDDVLVMHSGKTVEINNTDAEGRLLLADGVSYAARKLKADIIIDAATLTGAQGIATGRGHAAIVSNDAVLERMLIETGFDTGDLVHPLPFAPELYQREFTSQVADMKNSVKDRANAQSSCAAQFIYEHLPENDKLMWAHVDLAKPAFLDERGTGYGVPLLSQAVWRLA
ncbi:MAG: peptidase M17 [Planctomycetota bacterium]|nr:MAG: peptidase M17 [Planctomycetota bacterium]